MNWTIGGSQRQECRAAYVKRYEAGPEFTFPKDFDPSRYNLLLCESMRTGEHTTVFLYWMSEERACAQEPLVKKILGITSTEAIGPIVEVLTPRMPKFIESPSRWGKWLLSAAALFGAISVIRDHFTELFYPPNVVIFASNPAVSNYRFGDPVDVPMTVRNVAPLGQANVHLRTVRLKPVAGSGNAQSLQSDITDLPQLQPGQNAEVHVSGPSPRENNNGSEPEQYALELDADAKEGVFLPKRRATYRPFVISFWPDQTWSAEFDEMSPRVAQIKITLRSGINNANGLHGQITFKSAVAPDPNGFGLPPGTKAIGSPIIASDLASSIAKIEFQTQPLQSFHSYRYLFSVAFEHELTVAELKSLESSVRVEFE